MDPNEALRATRELVDKVHRPGLDLAALPDAELAEHWRALAESLAEHAEALDEWLTKGGWLPQAWAEPRERAAAAVAAAMARPLITGGEFRAQTEEVDK